MGVSGSVADARRRDVGWSLSIWGPTSLAEGPTAIDLRPRERAVLAALTVDGGAAVSTDRLIAFVWGDDAPASAHKSLRNHVSRIRTAAGGVITTNERGYALADFVEMTAPTATDLAVREPFSDLADTPEVTTARALERQRQVDAWFAKMNASPDAPINEVEAFVAAHPDYPGARRLAASALAADGRRPAALAMLGDEMRAAAAAGLQPDRELRDLERRLLDDDPTLRRGASDFAATEPRPIGALPSGHLITFSERLAVLESPIEPSTTRLVAVTGPAGIGKTTLVELARDRSHERGVMAVLVACNPEPSVPLEPIVDLLHQLVERFPAKVTANSDVNALLALAPALPLDRADANGSPPDRAAILDAVAAAIGSLPIPLMLIIEDLHWATALTSQLLLACSTSVEGSAGVTIITTSRTEVPEILQVASAHLALEPWSSDIVEEYVGRFGRSTPWVSAAAAWVHRQSGGNALHVRELTMSAHEVSDQPDSHEPSSNDEFVAPIEAPPSLLASLQASLAELDRGARRDVDAAAVLGRRFRRSEWAAMGADVDRSLAEAEAAGVLVVEDDTARLAHDVRFRHDLLHQVVLDQLSDGQRTEWHDMAAQAIESSVANSSDRSVEFADRAAELAHHAVGAIGFDPRRAVEALRHSVDVDTARFAHEEAIEKCRTGIVLASAAGAAPDPSSAAEFEVRLGKLLLRIGDPTALQHLLAAAEQALDIGDDMLVAEAIRETCRLGPTSVVGAVHETARDLLDRAVANVTDPQAKAIVATAGVMLLSISGDYDRCRRFFDQAAEYRGDNATRCDALALAVLVLTEPDDLERRVAIAAELAELAEVVGTADARWGALHLRMANQVQVGDPGMRSTLAELAQLASLTRQRARRWEFTNWSASVALTDGDPARAEALATEALDCVDAVSESLVMSAYGAQLLSIRHAQGRVDDLLPMVQSIIEGDDAVIGAWHAVLALAAASAGDDALVRRQLDRICADNFVILDRDYTFNGALFAAALAACDVGAADYAELIEAELVPWSGQWGFVGTCAMGPVDVALARLAELRGDLPLARERAQRALSSSQRAVAPIYTEQSNALLDHLG